MLFLNRILVSLFCLGLLFGCKAPHKDSANVAPEAGITNQTSGGLQGNADGYSGHTLVQTAYQVDPDTNCGSAQVSYRFALDYYDNGAVVKRDECLGKISPVDPAQLDTIDGVVVSYERNIYEFKLTPPPPASQDESFYAGWCQATDVAQPGRLGLLIQTTPVTRRPSGLLYERDATGYTLSDPFAMVRRDVGFTRYLDSPRVQIEVRILPRDILANYYPGTLTIDGVRHPAFCLLFLRAFQTAP